MCRRHTQTVLDLCRDLGWVVNLSKSEVTPQQVFNFVDLSQGMVKPTQERWIALSQKINLLLGQETCSARQFMSLIGLLTATEKQVVSGRLHMRPIQWHLKKHWHVPEPLERLIPLPKSLHAHLRWWLDPNKVLKGQPLHPLRHTLQLFTDSSDEGWGAHLADYTAKGLWSKPEGALHINLLELKMVLLALKRFKLLCWGQTILVCTDNTVVVSYMNKEGDMKSGSDTFRSPKCHCRQTVKTQTGDSDGVVSAAGGFRPTLPEVAHTGSGLIHNQIQSQTSQVWVTGSGLFGLESRCFEPSVGGSGRLCLSSGSNSGTSGHQNVGPKVSQNDPDYAGMAQHAMVLGPCQHVSSNYPHPAKGE